MRRLAPLCLAGIVIGVMAYAPPAASAAPGSRAHDVTVSSGEQEAALAFWTPQRLAAAKDADALAVPAAEAVASPHPSQIKPLQPSVVPPALPRASVRSTQSPHLNSTSPQAWNSGGLISTTAGKVFFSNNSGTYACSGDAVNSGNRSVVATAGHCVVDANTGEVYRNWVFIPGYHSGSRPYGTFTARSLHWMSQRIGNSDPTWDAAFATMSALNGRSLVDTVGGEGIGFDQSPGQYVYSFGYGGSDAEGNGERLNWCAGTEAFEGGHPGGGIWGIDCIQTGGSSGGPFLQNFNTSNGIGTQTGNISVSGSGREWHPYYGREAHDAYLAADAA
ncbi:trypsin-like serine peptidase [Actinoplanes sp. NPDC051343]|uniref:trypsin-like serine peptidase n=1 Tax=Actinoplanes sp. NPDC051343 TaxID=3363906 RepID=UPI0037B327DD